MAWNNYNNGNNGYRNNTNPRAQQRDPQETGTGPTLYNESAGKFLNFNYWGKFASIEIGAVPMGSPMTWDARKNAQKVTQLISFADLSDLWDVCEEVLDSVKNTGTFTSTGVKVGSQQNCIVEINNGSTINMSPGIYLVIYKNLDSSNRTNNLEFYPFNKVKVLRGYDHSSGMAKDDISKVGEFKKFYRMIKEASKAFTMAHAHTVAVNGKSEKLATFKVLSAITASMGIDMTAELRKIHDGPSGGKSYGSGGRSSGGSGGGRGGYSQVSGRSPRSVGGTFEAGNAGTPSYGQQGSNLPSLLDDPVDISIPMDSLTNVDMSQFS